MAISLETEYYLLSDGMFGGTTAEDSETFTQKLLRILSHGFIDDAPIPVTPVPSTTSDFSWFRRGWFARLRKDWFHGKR